MGATCADHGKVAVLGARRGDWLCIGTSLDALGAGGPSPPPAPTSSEPGSRAPARFLMPGWRPPATTLCAARKQPSTGDQKVRKQAPEQVRLQVPTDDRDQTVGGCSYAALARAWRNGSYEGCEDLRPQCAASRASATPQPDTG